MSGEVTKVIDQKTLWEGGRSPLSVSYGKMMMWFFLISDALTFGSLLGSLGFMRHKYIDSWPISEAIFTHMPLVHGPDAHYPLLYVALMTFILIVSSVTMVLAVEAGHRMDRKGVTKWLFWTVIGGLIFVGSQAWEWSTFIAGPDGDFSTWADNATLTQNFYGRGFGPDNPIAGPVQYSQFFFFVTGFHGTHVVSGVILNFIILLNVLKGKYEGVGHYEMVEKVGLYWHFIDLVWVFVFTFYYLV
ncbi:MAG: cytochrome c oxidase subunit 3 [Salibacteraceae bacterium]|jgi:cytochrome c oxidase subunit 3|tara:strand:+ start:100 stop:834 length:735 start_codon:yes stop_codon:yes gene_type:complete